MARKFFNERVYNSRRTIANIIIAGICIVGIVICFILTTDITKGSKNKKVLNIKPEVTVEINENYTNDIFFSKAENVNTKNIKISYLDDFSISKVGSYPVLVTVNNMNYDSIINIVDTTAPVLNLKEVTIYEKESYSLTSFIDSCNDNSNEECILSFYEGKNEEGNTINYNNYTKSGIYSIKIMAKDRSDNQIIKETKLTIKKKNEETAPIQQICKYGDDTYDMSSIIIANFVTNNGCAINPELYNNDDLLKDINNIMATETAKIKRDVNALNLTGDFSLNRSILAIPNIYETGMVGYELSMQVSVTKNNKTEVIAEYKLDSNGKRHFTINKYNLK